MLGEKRHSRLFGTLQVTVFVLLASWAMAQEIDSSRHPITETDIANAVAAVGVNVNASQVHLPLHINATDAPPKLEIVTADPSGIDQVRLELRCPRTSECLPFLATFDVKDASAISAAIRLRTRSANTRSNQTAPNGGIEVDQDLQRAAISVRGDRTKLKVGSHAVLEIRDGYMDIHLQVLAIDSGSIGQQVRVCTLDRKKVFRATVTGEGSVSGVME